MPTLSAKTAINRASLKTSAHNRVVAQHTNGHNPVLRAKHKHGGLSHDQKHFSLHGIHRTAIGIGRYYHHTPSYTPFKGNLPTGHGGSHGNYKVRIVQGSNPERCATNNGTPDSLANAQTASLNKHSDLQTRHADLYHGTYPRRWVQYTRGHMSAEEYIQKITEEAMCANQENITMNPREYDCDYKCAKCERTNTPGCCEPLDTAGIAAAALLQTRRYRPAKRKKLRADDTHLLFKIINAEVRPQSEYIKTRYLRKHNIPTPSNRQHYPTGGTGSACGISSATKTWEQAQAAGHLPADYRPFR